MPGQSSVPVSPRSFLERDNSATKESESGETTALDTLPPLSDSMAKLLALNASEQQNPRVLELLALRDPAVTARLLALASSPLVSRQGPVRSMSGALQALGTQRTYDAMMAVWAASAIPCLPQYEPACRFLVRHTFTTCAIIRRLAVYSELFEDEHVTIHLLLYSLLSKVSLAMCFSSEHYSVASAAIDRAGQSNRHRLLSMPELNALRGQAVRLAKHWDAPEEVVHELQLLADVPHRSCEALSTWGCLLTLAELIGDASFHEDAVEALQALQQKCAILQRLVARDIDPLSFRIKS